MPDHFNRYTFDVRLPRIMVCTTENAKTIIRVAHRFATDCENKLFVSSTIKIARHREGPMVGRREFLGIGAVGATLFASSTARACTIVPVAKAEPFRRIECEQQIHDLVAFMNEAPNLSAEAVSDWVDRRGIDVEFDYPLSENVGGTLYNYLFFREYKISGGKIDRDPIKIKEINLLRHVGNKAAFQFTLARNQFFPADLDGCNGLFTHEEYFEKTDTSFIGRFLNNKFNSFRDFPEWFV